MRLVRPLMWSLAGLAIAGCQATAEEPLNVDPVIGAEHIEMHHNAFDPPVVEVPVGSTVTWAFTDSGTPHNVVGDDFESDIETDGTFSHTFMEPGTYDYTCALHSGMGGRVIVTDG